MNLKLNDVLYSELTNYINVWNTLNYKPRPIAKTHINYHELITFTHQFKPLHEKYLLAGNAINIWDVCGIGCDELKHCQVLSWLLDYKGSHGIGHQFLYCLIDYLNTRSNNTIMSVTTEHILNSYRVLTETSYVDKETFNRSRVDIEIENKQFLMFIEVKVHASETDDQLIRYYKLGKLKSELDQDKPWELIFLTKRGNRPIERQDGDYKQMSDKVICLSWQEVAYLLRRFSTTQNARPFLQKILNQYSHYIKKYFFE